MGRRKTPPGKQCSGPAELGDEVSTRLAYFRLTPSDLEALEELAPLFDAYLDEFVDDFYDHLQRFPQTARFLRTPGLIEHLKQSQKAYFRSLFSREAGEEVVQHRKKIGDKHAEVGLDPAWFLGAYALYLDFCLDRLAQEGKLPETFAHPLRTLLKRILFDISLTLDAYFARTTDQLRFALDMLQKSNTELKDFARLVGHDMRTPLATILGLCDETLDEYGDELPKGACELIEEARAQTRRLAHLLHELVSIGTASGDVSARENVSPERIIEQVLDRLRGIIEERNVVVHIEKPLPRVRTHPGRLREIFYQVLSNAVKFSLGNPPEVRIRATEGEDMHTFYVEDTGPGIEPEYIDLMFTPFWRHPRHRNTSGTGLGLYFLRTMVEEQGGTVEVKSEPGKGTCFAISLPASSETYRVENKASA